MTTGKFEFRTGSRITGIEPAVAGKELERIRKKVGLTPKNIVREATPVKAPLHPVFEWDNKVAANSYREQQARHLIRSVVVRVDETSEPTPVYVHVRNQQSKNETGTYEPIGIVVEQPDMFVLALDELVAKMNSATHAVKQLEEAAATTGDHERMAKVVVAVKAIELAADAVRSLH